MRFKIWVDGRESILCEFCGSENSKLLADPQFGDAVEEGVLAFYKCSRCGCTGFPSRQPGLDDVSQRAGTVFDDNVLKGSH